MSHENHPPSPSGSFARSASIEYPMPNSYPAHESGPNRSSVMVGISESHLPEHGQRTVAAHHVGGECPELSDVRPVVNSSNMITDSIGNRSWDQTGGQPQGFSDLGHQNNSGYAVATADGNSGAQPPSFSGAAQRDRSNNGGSDDTEPLNPLDYAGISLVGGKVTSASVPPSPRSQTEILQSGNLKSFNFNILKTATRNFRPDSVLGEGGFGTVFRGWINEQSLAAAKPGTGTIIAVKRLNHEGIQGHPEWLAEINYLGQLNHPNLVKLIGYCLEDDHRLLVYEFMPRGSLENHLFRRSSYFQPLSWNLRIKVAIGAAKGLAYLHSPEAKVIYRDFKSSNILIDSNYNAKLSDFGLARDGPVDGKSHVSTRVMGTEGYADPEYMATGHLTTRCDIYSFGVVLLELLTGRRCIDKNRPSGEQILVVFAKPFLASKQKILHIMDPRIEGQYSSAVATRAASLAMKCLMKEPKHRPTADELVKSLEQIRRSWPEKRTVAGKERMPTGSLMGLGI